MSTTSKTSRWDVIALVGMGIWLSWAVVSIYLGGDALLGKEVDGKYFLASHGNYKEVSSGVFTFSRIHGYIAWVCWGIAVLIAITRHMRKANEREDAKPVI